MGLQRVRGTKAVVAFAGVLAATALLPAAASAQGNLVNGLVDGLLGQGGGGGAPDERAGAPPNYTPPLHGSNPHGQGSVGVVDLDPSDTLPLPADPEDGDEELTVGDSRGEDNGTYHGRVTLLHVNIAGVINESIVEVETNEGETNNGPLAPLQTTIDAICTGAPPAGLGQAAGCISVASMNSSTSASGSQNSFGLAGTDLTVAGVGLDTGIATSSGSISDDGTCQTANGSSGVANANAALPGVPAITASALQGSSTSQACNNGSQSQSNSSSVITIMGTGLPLPAAGCANGTPDTNFVDPILGLIGTVCNADDSNSGQAGAPYGVREALTVFALLAGDPLIKVTTAGPESRAVAPPAAPAAPAAPGAPGAPGGDDQPGGGPGGAGEGNPGGGPITTTAQAGGDELPFTGASLLVLAVLGGALTLSGLALARSSKRHRRATA